MAKPKHITRPARFKKSDTAEPLTNEEIRRLAEKLATTVCQCDTESTQLIVLLLQHLWNRREDSAMFWCALHEIESQLFIVTSEADEARNKFRADAYKNRATILQWPGERKVSA